METFERIYAAWEEDLYREWNSGELIFPLSGFESDAEPITLGTGLSVRPMTDDEVARCLQAGLIDAVQGRFALLDGNRWCVAAAIKTRRVVLRPNDPGMDRAFAEWQRREAQASARADQFVRALQIFQGRERPPHGPNYDVGRWRRAMEPGGHSSDGRVCD